jgi:hypothetical protein
MIQCNNYPPYINYIFQVPNPAGISLGFQPISGTLSDLSASSCVEFTDSEVFNKIDNQQEGVFHGSERINQ